MTRAKWQAAAQLVVRDQNPALPEWSDAGVPMCSEECPHHDGKRCQLIGFRAPNICEPVVEQMAEMLTKAKAK